MDRCALSAVLLTSVCVNVLGCGSPMQPTVTTTAVTVSSSSDLMLIGTTEAFSAVASHSDGSSGALATPTWGSDNPAVARVVQNGVVEALGAGSATIFADSQGVRGSKRIRVVPRFAGTWQGKWQHLSCTSVNEPGSSFDWCNGIRIGDMSALTLILTQDRDTTRGSLNLSGVLMVVEGSIALDGTLSLTGNRPRPSGGYDQSVTDWRSVSDGSRLEGTFTWSSTPPPPAPQRGFILSDSLYNVVRVN